MSKTRDDSLVELTELLTRGDHCPHHVGLPSFVEGKSCPKKCRLCWETAIGFLYDGELARLKNKTVPIKKAVSVAMSLINTDSASSFDDGESTCPIGVEENWPCGLEKTCESCRREWLEKEFSK